MNEGNTPFARRYPLCCCQCLYGFVQPLQRRRRHTVYVACTTGQIGEESASPKRGREAPCLRTLHQRTHVRVLPRPLAFSARAGVAESGGCGRRGRGAAWATPRILPACTRSLAAPVARTLSPCRERLAT